MTHPSVYSFVFIRSDCECHSPREQETDGATSFIRSKKQALQCLVCSPCLRQMLSTRFPGQLPRGGRGRPVTLLRKSFLQGGRVNAAEQLTSRGPGIGDQGRSERRTGGHLRHSLSPSSLSSVTRSLTQEALELHYPLQTLDEKGVQRAAGSCCSSDTTIPVLDFQQVISNNYHYTFVSAEHV